MINLIRRVFATKPLTRKILAVEGEFYRIINSRYSIKFWIDWYGAYDINPTNLVFWVCVETDELKLALSKNKDLERQLRSAFGKHQYPEYAIPFIYIGFESQETVARVSNGNWYHHFK